MKVFRTILTAAMLLTLTGCEAVSMAVPHTGNPGDRETVTEFLSIEEGDSEVYGNSTIRVNCSNSSKGYILVQYNGAADKVQIQITNPDGSVYPYPLALGSNEPFPLSMGDGTYTINVLEHAYGDMYSAILTQSFNVTLNDEFAPFLVPNEYAHYTGDSECVKKGMELSDQAYDDLSYVTNVYNFVTETIVYDDEFAANIPVNYIPDPDRTLQTKKGICFDYVSLMGSMLRSQAIPTKLEVGYSGTIYHAWISVYLKERGWVRNIIQFDGKNWSLVDPTYGSYGQDDEIKQYIGDGTNYTVIYEY